jgi:hypothetical protein
MLDQVLTLDYTSEDRFYSAVSILKSRQPTPGNKA